MRYFARLCSILVLGLSLCAFELKGDWQDDLFNAIKRKQETRALSIVEQHKHEIRSARYANPRDHTTFLHEAALEGLANLTNALIEAGANIQAQDDFENIPLDFAILSGNLDTVRALVEHGRTRNLDLINWRDRVAGRTRLHTAVNAMIPDILRYLLDQGANRDVATNRGQTPLDLAREHQREPGFHETVQPLIEILENHWPSQAQAHRPGQAAHQGPVNLVQAAQQHFQAAQQQQAANTGIMARVAGWWRGGGSGN